MGKTSPVISFRRMLPEDATEVAAIEKRCFRFPWSRESFWQEASNEGTLYLLALDEDARIIGYAGAWLLGPELEELHVMNVAVAPESRNAGVGQALFAELIRQGKERGAKSATLEVRPSNGAAIALYEKFGLRSVGRRPGYYEDGEDALIFWNTKL